MFYFYQTAANKRIRQEKKEINWKIFQYFYSLLSGKRRKEKY